MGESADTRELCAEIAKCNGMTYPIIAQRDAPAGWPDRFICHAYWTGMVEFKGPKTKLEPLQAVRIRELNRRKPGFAYVVRLPNRVENERGELLAEFDTTALGLLRTLQELTNHANGTNLGKRDAAEG